MFCPVIAPLLLRPWRARAPGVLAPLACSHTISVRELSLKNMATIGQKNNCGDCSGCTEYNSYVNVLEAYANCIEWVSATLYTITKKRSKRIKVTHHFLSIKQRMRGACSYLPLERKFEAMVERWSRLNSCRNIVN